MAANFPSLDPLGADRAAEREPADAIELPPVGRAGATGGEIAGPTLSTIPYIPLVRAQTIEGMPVLLDRMNVRFDRLLQQVGLPAVPLDGHSGFLPLRDVLAVAERAARVTGMEYFGVQLATTEGLRSLGDFGRYVKAAPTLLEAIRRASRYMSWQTLGARLSLTSEGRVCAWRYGLSRGVRDDRQHAYLFALVLLRDFVRLAAGPDWFPREIRLEAPAPRRRSHWLEETFCERITWGAGENALVFDQSLLALPLLWTHDGQPLPTATAALALDSGMPPADFVGSLRQLIRSFLSAGYPSAALMARTSGLSLRSFQRALTQGGVSFSDLVDQVRFEMAAEMLRDPGARLIDIGLELGYSDAANFTRAFRRWTGQAPRQYRQTLT